MMNKEYKNFNGLNSDLDLDSEKDFVNQVGTWSDIQETMTQYGGESSDTLSDLTTTIAQAGGTNMPTESVQEKLDRRRSANKGKGIGAFAKGLGQGLGLLTGGQTPPPKAVDTDAQTAGYTPENRNPVIPILIGLIGVSILVFAISKSKKGQAKPMPMPMPTA
jgi:hypothetical protein